MVADLLAGRSALITAGARRLGAALTIELARHGAHVAINYRTTTTEAQELVTRLKAEGHRAIVVQGDVSQPEEVARVVQTTLDELGALDILVHNAGPWTDVPLTRLEPAVWDWIMNSNVKGGYLAARLAFPAMRDRGWGRIINIGATSAFVRNHSVYGLAKNALHFLTEELAVAMAPAVTVNAIAPGLIDDGALPDDLRQTALNNTPLHRLVTFAEVAHMVALLCSPAFDMVTGQVIIMDGGRRLPLGDI